MNAHLEQRVEHYGTPLDTATVAAIVVHGRAQSPEWMREHLIDRLDAPGVAFVAPEAADNTWYPGGFMQDFDANEPSLTWALERIDQLVAQVESAGFARCGDLPARVLPGRLPARRVRVAPSRPDTAGWRS